MRWQFWNNGHKVGKLSAALSAQLGLQFSLSQDSLDQLMYISKPGKFVGTRTTFVRIFDPSFLGNTVLPVRRYKDLDAFKSAIHFQGRWQSGGLVDVSDLRTAKEVV